ncbi:hypothetical protein ACQP2F_09760 [Actinoplanes sp. CA-030573]|uniref:hypothetical protein n=1 Tax=Actinoplanes sp. CA-030573 TaxID=3239898 RepID=UPI003D943199
MIGRGRTPAADRETGRVRGLGAADREAGRKRAGGRRPALDASVFGAPVDGTAALKPEAFIDLDARAEPLRIERAKAEPLRIERAKAEPKVGQERAPRLRVAPPAPISAPRAPFVASVIGVVIVGVLGILLINTKTNENSFRIADLQKQDTQLDTQQQDLDNQLVEVSSIGNLDAAARRLGLVKADNPALFTLPDGKIIGVLTPVNGKPAVTAGDAATGKTGDAATGKTGDAATGKTGDSAGTPTTAATGGITGTGH